MFERPVLIVFLLLLLAQGAAAVSARAQIDVKVEGCFRQQGSNHITCRIRIENRSHVNVKTRFNTSSDRRTSGLDNFVSWAWDNFGQQYQIIDARIGAARLRLWRLPFEVPGGLRIPGEIVVGDVAPNAQSFSRLILNFSPKQNVSRGL